MYRFNVPDMTCGHCVSAITKAVTAEDPKAKVEISLAEHLVQVETSLSSDKIAQSITEAGYSPCPAPYCADTTLIPAECAQRFGAR